MKYFNISTIYRIFAPILKFSLPALKARRGIYKHSIDMKLQIKNLGAIGSGSIDLTKKFNLLCGPNGTGKTYFAFVVYGLFRNKLHVKGDEQFADELLNNRHTVWKMDFQALSKYREAMKQALEEHLGDLFGLGDTDCKKIFAEFSVTYEDSEDMFKQRLLTESIEITDTIDNIDIRIFKGSDSDSVEINIVNETISADSVNYVRFALQSMLFYNLCLYPIRNVVMFPVERNSIYTFSKELSIRKQEVVDSIQMMIDKDKKYDKFEILFNSKRYPLPIKDGLVVAEDLVEKKKTRSEFYDFAEEIEAELLKGKVQISNDGEIQFRPKKAANRVLPIQVTASIIKTMASLVIYLKHLAKKNDLIIIDEPEINLHPENQLVLTRILARLMNKGFRLLISTHSDYIIREINNLVVMSHSDNSTVAKLAEEKKYQQEEFIREDDIDVLTFGYRKKSSKLVEVKKQKVDKFGFDIESIDMVIEEQTDFSEKLYYALKYPNNAEE